VKPQGTFIRIGDDRVDEARELEEAREEDEVVVVVVVRSSAGLRALCSSCFVSGKERGVMLATSSPSVTCCFDC